nr:PD40 domain-containing protein [Leadbetterella sp.]
MKILFFVFCFQVISFAQNGTEIYLLEIQKSSNGFKTQNPVNISNRSGYDNQPSFHPTQSLIYFSSQKDGQTDIWSYNYDSKKLRQITNTEDSEYSPTVTPDQQFLSCIVQRKSNGDQDFVKFSIKNPEKSEIILESQKAGKIGYHAWSPDNELITFVLGEPNTLQLFENQSKSGKILGKNIGRSLHYVESKKAFSFVEMDDEIWYVKLIEPKNQKISIFAEALIHSELYNCWNKEGVLF